MSSNAHWAAQRASTGLEALDAVLGGLYWGDNVVWHLDGVRVEPFYEAIAALEDAFDTKTIVSVAADGDLQGLTGLPVIRAGPHTVLEQPADLLREIDRLCRLPGPQLLLFGSLDGMVEAWGVDGAGEFFSRCCPLLLDVGAIAYWSMSARKTPTFVKDSVQATTQCVLRVDERCVRVEKAEGRDDSATDTVLHWHLEAGKPVLVPAEMTSRVAGSLRAIRRARGLNQHELADLAGVTSSAISQVERSERGLSLATLLRLSDALKVRIDDLLRGENSGTYRVGRRRDDPRVGPGPTVRLLSDARSDLRIDLVHLDVRASGAPEPSRPGVGIIAVASGLVQVSVEGQTPTVRHGEVLVADSERIDGWRSLGQAEAELFWIVRSPARRQHPGAA
jgi:transcriptional regulator with XRE-family HTH domain